MFSQLFGSELSKGLFRLFLWGAGLASISMMVWTLGPLIQIGGFRPLDNYLVREAVIMVITATAASFAGFQFYRRRKSSQQLAEGIGAAKDDDGVVLKDRMKDALATLRKASGGKGD